MLRYGYFDSNIIGVDEEGMPIFDRAELSDLFCLFFANLVSDGVLALPSTCFKIVAAGNGLNIERMPGFGMIKGHFCYDDESDTMTLTEPQKYSRIDRVIMRLNLLDRMVEIIVKEGVEAAKPQPPELIRPSAGDYYELCLAEITLSPKQATITQSSINDTRANSALCGFITQLIDHLDTAVFFDQLNAFYQEFVDKSNYSYEQFNQMIMESYISLMSQMTEFITNLQDNAKEKHDEYLEGLRALYQDLSEKSQQKYDSFKAEITEYIESLTTRGDTNLAAIIQQMLDFRDMHETEFLKWLKEMEDRLRDYPPGDFLLQLEELKAQQEDIMEMLQTGMVYTKLLTNEGNYIVNDKGKPILVRKPICQCKYN